MLSQTAALFRVYHALKHGAEDIGIDFGPVEFAAFEQKAASAGIEIGDGLVCLEKSAVDVGEACEMGRQGFGTFFRGRVEGLEKCGQDFVCIFAGFVRMAFDEFGKAVFGEDFGVFGKKAEEQAGQEDIEGMDVFGFFEMVVVADLVEKAPHFFGGFGVGRIFFKSAAFSKPARGRKKP